MSLASGLRLGAYEIRGSIGVGGMGEVYRARDTKLNRDVALKVLPEQFAVDPDRRARFKREAQILASLNHPNIASIHGLEESQSVQALVLELVEGPTLADRISRGPIPFDELCRSRGRCRALSRRHRPSRPEARQYQGAGHFFSDQYAVTADAQRFLVLTPVGDGSETPITIVFNWTAALKN